MYKILIVDDEQMIREGIRSGLPWKKLNIGEVYTAGSAKEALRVLGDTDIQVVLTDISMEGMDGLELATRIRTEHPDIRIIMITAFDRFEYAKRSLQIHVNDFLLKPIDEEELYAAIDRQIQALEDIAKAKHVQPVKNNLEHVQLQKAFAEVRSDPLKWEELDAYARRHFLRITDVPYEVVILMLLPGDGRDEAANRENQEFLWRSAQLTILELVDNEDAGVTFYSRNDAVAFVLYCDEKDEPQLIIENLKNVIYSEFGLRVRVAYGSVVSGVRNFYGSYREAEALLKESFGSYKTEIRSRHTEFRSDLFSQVFAELKKEMLSDISNLKYICRVFDAFTEDTKSYQLELSEVQARCFELASALYYAYVMQTGEKGGNQLSELMPALMTSNAEEACAYTRGFIVQLLGQERKTDNASIGQARLYIDQHIGENLSVTILAEKYYMSVSYFSRLFKKEVGMGCNEYIVQSRIRLAQELLTTTPMTVSEIAERVGYRDKNYFSLAFRRNTGVPPTEYRERQNIN